MAVIIPHLLRIVMEKTLLREDGPKCGCGRSPTGYCIGWHGLTEEEWKAKLVENGMQELKKESD